jgi:formate hydrogenlyase transcriptional activator
MGIRAVWSRPLFTREGKVLGTFAIHYREVRSPDAIDLQMIESAGHIAGIAIERHLHEQALRRERDRLRLLLEITSSVTSRLEFRQVVEALSTNLFRIMQCDMSVLLLPDSETGELRVNVLYNPDARGPMRRMSGFPLKVGRLSELID